MLSKEIRSKFINYFKDKNHKHIKSSSLIPNDDSSLMFVNSGMVQFKDIFTGKEISNYQRATSCQKCIRAGGKHNDLENVGYTSRHHTFFEMLGNFSFRDYFKEESIYYAWDLLTNIFNIPKDKLYITVYKTDNESYNLWKKISGFKNEKIIRIDNNDNFWSMGDLGPCGPSSEIFYDHGEKIEGGLPGTSRQDGDRYVEIWNIVFMQYEKIAKDKMIELSNNYIDTGMGLERITTILQNLHDNYEIDIFQNIIKEIEDIISIKINNENQFSFRIIADHIRSSGFLIGDGVMPSNEGRGYVLRRIIRRSIRHIHQLGIKEPIMWKLLPCLINIMGEEYKELSNKKDYIAGIIFQEEEKFHSTISKGLSILNQETVNLKSGEYLKGSTAFKLYDTYGFPLDLTQDILKDKNIFVDINGFDKAMKIQKLQSSYHSLEINKKDTIWFEIFNKFGITKFMGYHNNKGNGKIIALIQNNQTLNQISNKENFILITDQTPFYGEAGGQVGDIGIGENHYCKIQIIDTKKYLGKIIAHICKIIEGEIFNNHTINLVIEKEYRKKLSKNHTATHILHSILKKNLGNQVAQQGSLVEFNKIRLDISYNQPIPNISQIENDVNDIILENHPIKTNVMNLDDALQKGAIGLFTEKYEEIVRVVSIKKDQKDEDNDISIELCGGTHVENTGEIGLFKIISESSIGSGIRRIEAITGNDVIKFLYKQEDLISNLCHLLQSSKKELYNNIKNIKDRNNKLEIEINNIKINDLVVTKLDIMNGIDHNNIKIIQKTLNNIDVSLVRSALEISAKKNDNLVVFCYVNNDSRISLLTCVSYNISNKINAKDIITKISMSLIGKKTGGGSKIIAQTGGFQKIDLEKTIKIIKNNCTI